MLCASSRLNKHRIDAINAEIAAESVVVEHVFLVLVEVVVGEHDVKYLSSPRIKICGGGRTGLLRKEAELGWFDRGVLSQEMVVLILIDDQGYLRSPPRAFQFKGAGKNPIGIISHEPRNHIGACLRVAVIEFRIAANGARLVERSVAVLVIAASFNLLRVNDIHRIGETVVGETNCGL